MAGGNKEKNNKSAKLWGGRFSESASDVAEKISSSIDFDARLYRQDIRGSMAHAEMLNKTGLISDEELDSIKRGLREIEKEIDDGLFIFDGSLEDIHMNIESALTRKIGDAGRKLHTARSRNDQIALDLRLYIRDEANEIAVLLKNLIDILTGLAEKHIDIIMPGYTHLQVAQVVRLSHHLLAHAWAFVRDLDRLGHVVDECKVMPLGVGALAGVNYKNDRDFLKEAMGFHSITPNSMDTVGNRDFVLDFLYFAAVLGMHLSRFCEEIVLWSTDEFNYIRLPDGVTTGSSIMPQKRNPDIAELIRGKSGRLYGNLISLLTTLKGLPLTYNRDLQEDKEPLFDSVDTIKLCVRGVAEMISTMEIKDKVLEKAVYRNFITATDLADYLAKKGVPFRKSHEIVGNIVRHVEENNLDFYDISLDTLRSFSPDFGKEALEVLDPHSSPERKKSAGGTSKSEISGQIRLIGKLLKEKDIE